MLMNISLKKTQNLKPNSKFTNKILVKCLIIINILY